MRIWMGVQRLWRGGGTETHVITLAQALRQKGHQVTFCTSGGAWVNKVRRLGFPVHVVAMNQGSGVALLRNKLLFSQVDVLHAHDSSSLQAFAAAVGPLLRSPKLVYTVHGTYVSKRALVLARRRANEVIVVSATAANLVAKSIPRTRLTVVPNGVDTTVFRPAPERGQQFRQQYRIPLGARVIGYSGRFTFDKINLGRRTVRVLAKYAEKNPGVHILVAGRGSGRLGIRVPRVHVVGHIESMQNFFNACDGVIATGRTAVEAALCGANVVALGTAGLQGRLTLATLSRLSRTNFGDHGPHRAWSDQQLWTELASLRHRRTQASELSQLRQVLAGRLSAMQMANRIVAVYRHG
ncbi:glycosyltransferase [Alicyclobacillus sp. ALC3]|uniref:glycosyltransferase n=1 Tax=Alicyclobacillus sp. ALC3 TaxID=2796143 RepID=UPI0023795BD5|nr:glycosyltransferase [Alicyclobacillus sp. ALC3]WDL96436.1 glycosyltransferase [Alicyclobacillus sp. ALC3]